MSLGTIALRHSRIRCQVGRSGTPRDSKAAKLVPVNDHQLGSDIHGSCTKFPATSLGSIDAGHDIDRIHTIWLDAIDEM